MKDSKFVTLPKHFTVSVDETDGHFLLSTDDQDTILKVDKSSVVKEGNEHLVRLGTPVSLIKGVKPVISNEKVELEIYDVDGCSNGKKYCQSGVTLCCEPPHVIVGTCEGSWSDC